MESRTGQADGTAINQIALARADGSEPIRGGGPGSVGSTAHPAFATGVPDASGSCPDTLARSLRIGSWNESPHSRSRMGSAATRSRTEGSHLA
jgi:hypothetical protein